MPSKPEFGRLLDWYAAELPRLGVGVHTSTRADTETVSAWAPDVVVVAVGGTGRRPPIPGIARPRVTDVRDWLRHPQPPPDHNIVTIWGADRAGVAAAAAATAGHRVLLVGAEAALAGSAAEAIRQGAAVTF